MRGSSPSREKRGLFRGRRFLVSPKTQKSVSNPKLIKPKTDYLENSDLDESFKKCAYPSTVEIFKLSQQLDMPPAKIKSEFQKRRQAFRQRHKMTEDTIVNSYALPWIFILIHILCSRFNCSQQTLIQVIVFVSSILSVWYAMYCKISPHMYNEEMMFLT